MLELLFVDTVCFVSWLVYAISQHTHFVPCIPFVWQLDAAASASGKQGPTGGEFVDGGQ